jgi:hypothetical protein
MQRYDEIIKITNAQNPEFDAVWAVEEWMRRNFYIITAEEYGLRRYERMLGITPLADESFAARRGHILVKWNQTTPYTFRYLVGLLEVLTNGNFEIQTNFNYYEMKIITFTAGSGIIGDLIFILRSIIPANIVATSHNVIDIQLESNMMLGAVVHKIRQYNISSIMPEGPEGDYLIDVKTGNRVRGVIRDKDGTIHPLTVRDKKEMV